LIHAGLGALHAIGPPAQAQRAGENALLHQQQRDVFAAALQTAAAYVVRIETIGGALPVERGRGGQGPQRPGGFRQADGPTTGVIWSSDGAIVTSSFNFMRDPSIITVRLSDGRRFVARLVARDRPSRIALLKINATGLPTPPLAPLEELRIGQWTLAAGFGHGSDAPAVSVGVLSATARMNATALQTDAKISPANYGGPLFDLEGRLLGVCVPLGPGEDLDAGVDWYDSGIGFAIRCDHLQPRVERLKQKRDLRRGMLGVQIDPREPVVGRRAAESPSDKRIHGVYLLNVSDGPAAKAGLETGDVITQINDVATPRLLDFRRVLARFVAGDDIRVTYQRDERSETVALTLASPDDFASQSTTQPAASRPADSSRPPPGE
jgi:serine protease Do